MTKTLNEETSDVTLPGCDSSSSGVTAAPGSTHLDYQDILIWEMEWNGYSVGVASGFTKIALTNQLLVKMEKRELCCINNKTIVKLLIIHAWNLFFIAKP